MTDVVHCAAHFRDGVMFANVSRGVSSLEIGHIDRSGQGLAGHTQGKSVCSGCSVCSGTRGN